MTVSDPAAAAAGTVYLSPSEIALLTPEEARQYEQLLTEEYALTSPLCLAEVMFEETRRWPHLVYLDEHLVALSEYRLTEDGPGEPGTTVWWYTTGTTTGGTPGVAPVVHETTNPHDIPEDAEELGATVALNGQRLPVVFQLAVSMRPRAGKSRLITEVFPFWLQIKAGRRLQIGLGTYSDTFAADWGQQARDLAIALNEKYPWFPYPQGGFKAPRDVFSTKEGGRVRYVGVGGGITGKTLNVLIGDDFIKNDEDAQSEATRLKSHRFYDRTWSTRKTRDLRPDAVYPIPIEIIMATRWHENDVLGHATMDLDTRTRKPGWCVINIPALCEDPDNDPLHRQEGEAHPNAAGETAADMRRLRDQDPRGFAALYQGRPAPEEGGIIPTNFGVFWYTPDRQYLSWYEDSGDGGGLHTVPADDLIYFSAADMAATEKTSADWTVCFAFGYSREFDRLFVLDRYRARITSDKYITELVPFMEANQSRQLVVENVTYGQAFAQQMRALARRGGTNVAVLDEGPKMYDKVSRAISSGLPMRGRFGTLLVPKGASWVEDAKAECAVFPYGEYDDQVDALAFGAWYAEELPGKKRIPSKVPKSLGEEIDEHVDRQHKRKSKGTHPNDARWRFVRSRWR